jgi:hypothetical protein
MMCLHQIFIADHKVLWPWLPLACRGKRMWSLRSRRNRAVKPKDMGIPMLQHPKWNGLENKETKSVWSFQCPKFKRLKANVHHNKQTNLRDSKPTYIIRSKWIQGIQSRHGNKQLHVYHIKPIIELLNNLINNTKIMSPLQENLPIHEIIAFYPLPIQQDPLH